MAFCRIIVPSPLPSPVTVSWKPLWRGLHVQTRGRWSASQEKGTCSFCSPRAARTLRTPGSRDLHHFSGDSLGFSSRKISIDVRAKGGSSGGGGGRKGSSRDSSPSWGGFGSYSGPGRGSPFPGPSPAPVLERASWKDGQRIGLSLALLALLTSLEVAVDGRLGGFVEGTLSLVVQALFAFVLLDVSVTLATWILGQYSGTISLAKCPWCDGTFKYDREAVRQHYIESSAGGPQPARMSCPNCFGELLYRGMDAEPFFDKGSGPIPPSGFGTRPKSWASEGEGKIVDVEAVVRDKD